MTDFNPGPGTDRRSSVRVRSLLPCMVRAITDEEIPAIEARILDVAVIESDSVLHDRADWVERTDELPRETVFVLREIRALRQQIAEIQRFVQADDDMQPRWVVINDNGLFVPMDEGSEADLQPETHVEVRLQLPSLQTPEVIALGEVVRRGESEDGIGVAIRFRYISQSHSKAIIRYALRRERQLARSLRFN